MRPSLRFLGLAVVGWVGMRAAALGMLPGGELFRIERSEARTPQVTPTQFPPIEPVAVAEPQAAPYPPGAYAQYAQYAGYAQPPMRPIMVPVYYPAPVSAPVAWDGSVSPTLAASSVANASPLAILLMALSLLPYWAIRPAPG